MLALGARKVWKESSWVPQKSGVKSGPEVIMGQICKFYAAAGTRTHVGPTARPFSCGLLAREMMRHNSADHGDPEGPSILATFFSMS